MKPDPITATRTSWQQQFPGDGAWHDITVWTTGPVERVWFDGKLVYDSRRRWHRFRFALRRGWLRLVSWSQGQASHAKEGT